MEELKLKTTNNIKHFQETPQVEKAGRFSKEDKQKIAEASKGFESILTGMMLKSMTSSVNGFFGEDSYGGDYFDSIFTTEIASHISNSRGMGIAEQIYRKVTGETWDEANHLNTRKVRFRENLPSKTPAGKLSFNSPEMQFSKDNKLTPSVSAMNRIKKYDNTINKVSQRFDVDKNLIKSIILAESAGKHDAVSKADAKGLMQLMDATAKEVGVRDSFNPAENILGGTKYFAQLLRQYSGDIKLSLAAYNAGPGNVQKFNGVPPFEETKNYINRVLGYYNYLAG